MRMPACPDWFAAVQSDLRGLDSAAVQLAQLWVALTPAHESLQCQVGRQPQQSGPVCAAGSTTCGFGYAIIF
jgi:hypothetical protein